MWHPSQVPPPNAAPLPSNFVYIPYPPTVGTPVLLAPAFFPNVTQNQPIMYSPYVFNAHPFPTVETNTQNTLEMTSFAPQQANYPMLVDARAPQGIIDLSEEELKKMSNPSAQNGSIATTSSRSHTCSKKCKKCNKFYRDAENAIVNGENPCRFHPGRYRTVYHSKLAFGNIQSWSCCKNLKREILGCKVGLHVEDVATTLALEAYDLSVNSMEKTQLTDPYVSHSMNSSTLIDLNFEDNGTKDNSNIDCNIDNNLNMDFNSMRETLHKKSKDRKFLVNKDVIKHGDSEYFKHQVSLTDTLSGLSLKYKVSVEEIKSANKLRKQEELYTRRELLIPYRGQSLEDSLSEEERKKYNQDMKIAYIKRFRRATNSHSDSEAKYYLKSNAWCLELAIQEHKEDSSWERQFPPPKPLSLKVS